MKTFNTSPYFDDYDENKQFYKIMFRPSYAVQARELTQLQSILQTQIQRHGDHMFKQGAMVVPGEVSFDTSFNYVKLAGTYDNSSVDINLDKFVGQVVTGKSSGVTAQVVHVSKSDSTDAPTLYVKYTNSGTDTVTKTFADNEVISTAGDVYNAQAISTNATGVGSAATVKRGVYYINGHFVLCNEQTVVLDKYSNTPSYRIGLNIVEDTITPEADETLLDNAQNSYNFAAPGAHRYYIDLVLSKLDIDSVEDENFVEILRVVDGEIKRQVTVTEYSLLENTLARRTSDESGDYVVRDFAIDIREHRNNDRGQWSSATAYLLGDIVTNNGVTYAAKIAGNSSTNAPTHTSGTAYDGAGNTGVQWEYNESPEYNRGIYLDGDESKLAIGLDPGKAYVQGYELEKIATEYVTVDKSREFSSVDNAVIPTTVGNYVLVTNINNLPRIDNFTEVDLRDQITGSGGRGTAVGTKIGTARIRGIEWDSGAANTNTSVYKLFLFDVKLNSGYDFNRDVKSFYLNDGTSSTVLDFSADISPIQTKLVGSAVQSGGGVTGTGTSFQTDLSVGDYVYIGTTLSRVTAISSQQAMTVSTSVSQTGVTLSLATTEVLEPENASLVFNLPYYAIRSVRNTDLGTNDNAYTVSERFTKSTNSSGTLSLTSSDGTFASAAETDNYLCVDNTTGSIVNPGASNITISGSTVSIAFGAGYESKSFTVIAAVNKTGAGTEKTKTLATATVTFTTQASATVNTLLLGKSDIFKIVSIKMKSGTFSSPGSSYSIDISDRYNLDNGQRNTHYDIGRLNLISSFNAPSAPVEVVYEYFQHSPTGDYFTVNSYPNTVSYNDIQRELRDSIDFRPRIDDAGTTFTGTGAVVNLMPKRGIDFRADYSYYLPRIDKIILDTKGKYSVVTGTSSLQLKEPATPSSGMLLYTLTLEPYTFKTDSISVGIKKTDNRRYTMRDIGKLEKRIENLEYYTSLSLLEQQTESLTITDSNGLDRFKNGFIVDSFNSQTTANALSPDYAVSMDMEEGVLRPYYTMENVNVIEKNTNNAQRVANNYQIYGDLITLPVTGHKVLVDQPYGSRLENINPFAIFTWIGSAALSPSTDDWFEQQQLPNVLANEGNYSAMVARYGKPGVLGTVWNAWQTTWSGVTGSSGTVTLNQSAGRDLLNSIGGNWHANGNWTLRTLTYETISQGHSQTRTGIRTSLVERNSTRVEDKLVSTSLIPYMRSRNVLIQVKRMKPATKFYPYFDDIDVSTFCTPSTNLEYAPLSGNFDFDTNVGGDANEQPRRITGDSQVCLNKGDVVYVSQRGTTIYTKSNSPATAVVVGKTYDYEQKKHYLQVVNVRGSFISSDSIKGSVSLATGTVSSAPVIANIGDDIITNFAGETALLFTIPNTPAIKFSTGTREFKLMDVDTSVGFFTSISRGTYRATGILNVRQTTITSVRNAELVSEQVVDNRVLAGPTTTRVISDTGWYDPLAQTFLVKQDGGAFLSKVDIYFASKDPFVPVTLQIREVVNGYPGKNILPFSTVTLSPDQVNLSSNIVTFEDGSEAPKYDTKTTFTFRSPVYVQDNAEYCIVLLSDSNNYRVWIAQMGDRIPESNRSISEQPYNGVLFKSQNASTWTANQDQDLKFTIHRAVFATNVVGDVEFVNTNLPFSILENNPVETRAGTNTVRIWHIDHSMPVGSNVNITTEERLLFADGQLENIGTLSAGTISITNGSTAVTGSGFSTLDVGTSLYDDSSNLIGVVSSIASNTALTLASNATFNLTSASYRYELSINGVPTAELFNTHVISNVDMNSYTITTTHSATANGYGGGSAVFATKNFQYDAIQPSVQMQEFAETSTEFKIKTTSGKSIDGSQTPYVLDSQFYPVVVNDTNEFYQPCMIASEINESDPSKLNGNKSLTLVCNMSSTNDALSPIIDTERLSVITISNKVNNPVESTVNVPALDTVTLFTGATGTFAFSGSTITSTNATVRGLIGTIGVGKYVTISSATTSANNGTYLVTAVSDNGTTATLTVSGVTFTSENSASGTTLALRGLYVSDIAPIGSSTYSNYITKNVKLTTPSSFIKIKFAAVVPNESAIEVYYKTSPVGSTTSFDTTNWNLISPVSPIPASTIGDMKYTDIDYNVDGISLGIPMFDTVAVKIVFKSTNSCAVPRVKDLRIIACA